MDLLDDYKPPQKLAQAVVTLDAERAADEAEREQQKLAKLAELRDKYGDEEPQP